jgi:hypothetical protein
LLILVAMRRAMMVVLPRRERRRRTKEDQILFGKPERKYAAPGGIRKKSKVINEVRTMTGDVRGTYRSDTRSRP